MFISLSPPVSSRQGMPTDPVSSETLGHLATEVSGEVLRVRLRFPTFRAAITLDRGTLTSPTEG